MLFLIPNSILQSDILNRFCFNIGIWKAMRPLRYFLYQQIPNLKQTDVYDILIQLSRRNALIKDKSIK